MGTVRITLLWLTYIVRAMSGRRRYVGVTPPFITSQRVYDRQRRRWLKFRIRDHDDWIQIEHIFLNEGYDLTNSNRVAQIRAFYERLVGAGEAPLILDLGANIGLVSSYFHQIYPEARIVAVEPDEGNCELARQNLPDRSTLLKSAISSKAGHANLVDTGRNCGFRVEPTSDGGVNMITVPAILEEFREARPFLIKIDIEGFEEDLFSSNLEWIDKFPILVIELHDWMLPGRQVTKNFLKAISSRDRDFMHSEGHVVSIATSL